MLRTSSIRLQISTSFRWSEPYGEQTVLPAERGDFARVPFTGMACKSLFQKWLPLSISELPPCDRDEVINRPDEATSACQQLGNSNPDVTCVKAMYADSSQKDAKQQSGEPVFRFFRHSFLPKKFPADIIAITLRFLGCCQLAAEQISRSEGSFLFILTSLYHTKAQQFFEWIKISIGMKHCKIL